MMMLLVSSMFTVSNCDLLGGLIDEAGNIIGDITGGGGGGGGGGGDFAYTPNDGNCEYWFGENNGNSTDCEATNCGNGSCEVGFGENVTSCPSDCSSQTIVCGNLICEWQGTSTQAGETSSSCPGDCAGSVPNSACGDSICDLAVGENNWCTGDCGSEGWCGDGTCQTNMGENSGWCNDCPVVTTCGDQICANDGSENGWCNDGPSGAVCGGFCGDGVCQNNESPSWCADCGMITGYCGDGVCSTDGYEDGWCYDGAAGALCAVAGYCGDGTCATDGAEDGWCYDSYNSTSMMYEVCNSVGFCGDGMCAVNGSEDNWCYEYDTMSASYTLCGAAAGFCGDGTCAADGSEDGWCAENGTTCVVQSSSYCGDGVCAGDSSEDNWCYEYDVTLGYHLCNIAGAAVCGDGVCASDGSEDGTCSEYDTTTGFWLYCNVSQTNDICGDGVCGATEGGTCYDQYNATYGYFDLCSGAATGDGVCAYGDIATTPADCTTTAATGSGTYDSFNIVSSGESVIYTYSVVGGNTYTVQWEDSFDNGGTAYTSDVYVIVYDVDGVTILDQADSGYSSPLSVMPSASGTLIIEVNAYYSSGTGVISVSP
jgi:hypothetical protein